jgi:hypothetical protein
MNWAASSRAIYVGAVLDVEDVDGMSAVLDSVDDPVRATPRAMAAGEWAEQWFADPVWIVGKRAGAEFDGGGRYRLG